MGRLIRQIVLVGLVFLAGYTFGLRQVRFFQITSSSIAPTLEINDRVASMKIDYPTRGMIVILRDPGGKGEILTKRVIGLPGERFEVRDGYVYINNEKLDEPYIKEAARYEIDAVVVPESCFILLGDNRNNSEDSSIWGPVEEELLIGQVFCRYWPIKKFGFFFRTE
ncbi:MAG: signal peptidase I [Candidatus Omnitrophica bacterium]|nr:signal peptidase I [Candidatus Omnitrophota bacterium]